MSERATTSRLAPGEDTIERGAGPVLNEDLGQYVIDWSMRPLDGGKLIRRRHRGKTKGLARAAALAARDRLLAAPPPGASRWTVGSSLAEYVEEVSKVTIEKHPSLSANSRRDYLAALVIIDKGLAGKTLGDLADYRLVEQFILGVTTSIGHPTAKRVRTVLSRYVYRELMKDRVPVVSPIAGQRLDLPKAPPRRRGGRALTLVDYHRVIDWLFAQHALALTSTPTRVGRLTVGQLRAQRIAAIDMVLLQSCTGLRITEARTMRWDQTSVDEAGRLCVPVTIDESKTSRSRDLPLLVRRISDHLIERRRRSGGPYLFPAPLDEGKLWGQKGCSQQARALYQEIHSELGIAMFEVERSHSWRTTLNVLLEAAPSDVRAAYLGHSVRTNAHSYTDGVDVGALVEVAATTLDVQHKVQHNAVKPRDSKGSRGKPDSS